MILHTGCIDYVAICEEFEPVGEGEHIPMYLFELKNGNWKPKKIDEQFHKLDKN